MTNNHAWRHGPQDFTPANQKLFAAELPHFPNALVLGLEEPDLCWRTNEKGEARRGLARHLPSQVT